MTAFDDENSVDYQFIFVAVFKSASLISFEIKRNTCPRAEHCIL